MGLIVREIEGELVLLDPDSDQIHQLNATATFIWRKSVDGASPEDIASELASQFEVEQDVAVMDVTQTLEALRALRVI